MKYKVWKFQVNYEDAVIDRPTQIEVPEGSIILCAKEQYDGVVVYFQVPMGMEEYEKNYYLFYIIPTGHLEFDTEDGFLHYLDTVMTNEGTLVWHIFYRRMFVIDT